MSTATADRIAQLRAEGEAAVAAAASTARPRGDPRALPRPQSRAAEPAARRRQAPARGARAGRQGRQPGAPGAAGRGRRAPGRARGRRARAELAADVVDVTLPGTPVAPAGHLHILTATRREIEDVFVGLGFRVVEGPEIDLAYYNFDALNHDADHPARGEADTFYVADDVVLRTQTSPMQVRQMELQPPPLYIIVPGRVYRPRQRRDAHAAVPPGRGPRGRRGHDARRPPGHAAGVRPRDLRRRPRGPPAPALLPVHRAVGRARRVLLQLQAGLPAGRLALPALQGHGLDRDPRRRRWWTRTSTATSPSPATTPSATRASPGAWASSGSPSSSTACRTCGMFFENDLRLPGAVRMRLPLFWLTDYVRPRHGGLASWPPPRDDRHRGRPRAHARRDRAGQLRRRPRARARAAPGRRPADASATVDDRRGRRAADRLRRAERRRRPDRRRRARPARSCPTAPSSRRQSCAASRPTA